MKNFVITILMLFIGFSFSACSLKATYDKNLISKSLKSNLNKVNTINVIVDSDKKIIKKSPTGFRGRGTSLEIEVGTINKNIAKEFFKQYFQNVEISPQITQTGITVKTYVTDYNYKYGVISDSTVMTIKVHIDIYIKGIKRLDKDYSITQDNNILLTIGGLRFKEGAVELFHKELLFLYETQFKKDLLNLIDRYY